MGVAAAVLGRVAERPPLTPVRIVMTPTGAHLSREGQEYAWCGVDVRARPSVPLEPGSDYGEHADDCRKCVATLQGIWRAGVTP